MRPTYRSVHLVPHPAHSAARTPSLLRKSPPTLEFAFPIL
jgi:hypothetical protein